MLRKINLGNSGHGYKNKCKLFCIPSEECHTVDEIMVHFNGKLQHCVFSLAKFHKWGSKVWGSAGQSCFLYIFDVCQGAENPDQAKSDVGVTDTLS